LSRRRPHKQREQLAGSVRMPKAERRGVRRDCTRGSGNGPDYTGSVSVSGPDIHDLDADGHVHHYWADTARAWWNARRFRLRRKAPLGAVWRIGWQSAGGPYQPEHTVSVS
jgi:hypothetical protein